MSQNAEFEVCIGKQDENCECRPMVIGEPVSTSGVSVPPLFQQPLQGFAQHALPSQKPIDLSCHEMDESMDYSAAMTAKRPTGDCAMEDSEGTGRENYCQRFLSSVSFVATKVFACRNVQYYIITSRLLKV